MSFSFFSNHWLRSYRKDLFTADLPAAVMLAAYLVPAGLGDASLANLPPQAGLYACLFSGLVFWIFCSSRRTVITTTSAISLLVGASVGPLANGDAKRFAAIAAALALFSATIAFVAWIARAGAIVNFISESVMSGWKCGVALFLASTQLPKLCGFHGEHGSFWENSAYFFKHLNETNTAALLVGAGALAVLILGKIFLKNKPVALFVVVGGIVLSRLLALDTHGVKLLGDLPKGLPALTLPQIPWSLLNELLPLALACFLLAAVETAAIGRMFAAKYGERFDANQELLGIGAANLAAGLGQGLPVSGGLSQSLVNEGSNAKTPLSNALAAGMVLLLVLFFSHWLSPLPQSVLAAVVLIAVAGLFKISVLKHLWQNDRPEFIAAIATFLGVLGFGLLKGVMIGAVISLVQVLRMVSRPHVAELGRIPGTKRFSDCKRNPDNEPIPGAIIFRPESGLVYFNIDFVCETILHRIHAEQMPPKLVVLDLSAAPRVDLQSAHALGELAEKIKTGGSLIQAVEAHARVRDCLRREGIDQKLGGVNHRSSVAEVVGRVESLGNFC